MKIRPKTRLYSISMKIRPKTRMYSIKIKIRPKTRLYSIRMRIRPKTRVYSIRMKIRPKTRMYSIRMRIRPKTRYMRYWPSVRSRWLDIGQVLFLRFSSRSIKTQKKKKKERGQYPAILTEQAWSIKDLLYGFTFKLKLKQKNKTGHETALQEKKFFIAGQWKSLLFSVHFWISM